ncbi:SDR family NAD(P)-dependent oxidoreductase [Marinimicrobium alkaliphilum]|uniref:SDR family NAD(P)-dependent oxidoreductase n=1 Tax=Marinimicrobium alkaliphilum TaxID=2202654 RepID=UPI000DBA571B|nr:SDR family NAD(P)-dependent oxidoreductase [Marinimicrobium alkaliphilum]
MKPLAVIVGANSQIAKAMIERWRDHYELIGIGRGPSGPGALNEYWQSDYSEVSLARVALAVAPRAPTLVFCAVGHLHSDTQMPEKKLADLERETLSHYFEINAVIPAMVLKYFVPCLDRAASARVVFLSAKVAGISDNRLGGWYGYRASKAALNMLIKTASIELARSHRKACLIALHPGTTATPLSAPFSKSLPPEKLFSAELTAERLCGVIEELSAEDNGRFVHWDGTDLPW